MSWETRFKEQLRAQFDLRRAFKVETRAWKVVCSDVTAVNNAVHAHNAFETQQRPEYLNQRVRAGIGYEEALEVFDEYQLHDEREDEQEADMQPPDDNSIGFRSDSEEEEDDDDEMDTREDDDDPDYVPDDDSEDDDDDLQPYLHVDNRAIVPATRLCPLHVVKPATQQQCHYMTCDIPANTFCFQTNCQRGSDTFICHNCINQVKSSSTHRCMCGHDHDFTSFDTFNELAPVIFNGEATCTTIRTTASTNITCCACNGTVMQQHNIYICGATFFSQQQRIICGTCFMNEDVCGGCHQPQAPHPI